MGLWTLGTQPHGELEEDYGTSLRELSQQRGKEAGVFSTDLPFVIGCRLLLEPVTLQHFRFAKGGGENRDLQVFKISSFP